MAKLQLSCTLLQSLLLDDHFHHCNWFQWIDWTCRSAKTVKVHIQGLPLAARFPALLELALYPEIDNIPHAALEWIKTNSIMELEVVARVCKGALEIETSLSGAYLCDKREGGGWRGDMQQDGRQARKHHAYGCYSRTRWDKGSDNVKVANTCPLALQAPLDCDQSGLSAFLMNICMRLWQHQHVWYSMTSTPCCVNRPGSTWDKKTWLERVHPAVTMHVLGELHGNPPITVWYFLSTRENVQCVQWLQIHIDFTPFLQSETQSKTRAKSKL